MIKTPPSPSTEKAELDPPPTSRVAQLLDGMKDDAAQLARQEAELAKREVGEAVGVLTRDGILMAVGLVFVLAALSTAFLAGAAGLAEAWALTELGVFACAALGLISAALVYLLLGTIISVVGWKHLRKTDLTPKHTLATLAGLAGFSPSPTRGSSS